jgi:hypothetical protein
MKNNNKIILLAMLAMPIRAQEVDFSFLKGLESKASESSNIDLGPEQMNMMKSFSGVTGVDMSNLISGLKRVKVVNLEFDKEGMYSLADAESVRAKVKGDSKWMAIVSVKEKGGFTDIMMHMGPNGAADGFLILAAEPRELTVVNLVGTLDLAKIARLGGLFGIPHIETNRDRDRDRDRDRKKEE